jgi:hypothetical protein
MSVARVLTSAYIYGQPRIKMYTSRRGSCSTWLAGMRYAQHPRGNISVDARNQNCWQTSITFLCPSHFYGFFFFTNLFKALMWYKLKLKFEFFLSWLFPTHSYWRLCHYENNWRPLVELKKNSSKDPPNFLKVVAFNFVFMTWRWVLRYNNWSGLKIYFQGNLRVWRCFYICSWKKF